MMNTMKPNLKFTPEYPEYFPDQKVPTLYTKVWIESNRSPTNSYSQGLVHQAVFPIQKGVQEDPVHEP